MLYGLPAAGKTCGTCKHVSVFMLTYATEMTCRHENHRGQKVKSLGDSCADHAWKSKEAEAAYNNMMGIECSCASQCANCNCGR